MVTKSGQLLFGILFSTAFAAFAQTPPPARPFDAITWKATSKEIPSSGVRMGTLFVPFEKWTLDDVRRAASVGDIAHRGDAGESAYWLCYTNLGKRQIERIWVISHGEMGEGGGFDLSALLLLHFKKGRVNSLEVGQVTSC